MLVGEIANAGETEWKLMQDQAEEHFRRGNLPQAEQFGREALKEAESFFGAEHRTTEQSLATLYGTLRYRGKVDEALQLVTRLVAIRTRHYGPDDLSTAYALHGSAEILIIQHQFVAAEKLQRHALGVFEKKLGPAHFTTAVALHNMGAIYLEQRQYKEAEKFLRAAIAAKEKTLKGGHLSVAHSLDSLALALDGQGRQIEAEKMKGRAEAIRRKAAAG
jgi:tetratricopeptide (TPR) repeat protein